MSDLARFTTAELQQMHTDLYKSATALYDKSDAAFNRGRVSMTPRPALADLLAAAAAAREQHELMTAVNDELQARYAAQEASRGLPEATRTRKGPTVPKHDKTSVFAAERMEPMTEAEYQAEKAGQDAPQASETPAPRKVRIDLAPSVHARLQEYQRAMSITRRSDGKARPWVTLNETMEYLLDLADAQAQLLAEVLEGK